MHLCLTANTLGVYSFSLDCVSLGHRVLFDWIMFGQWGVHKESLFKLRKAHYRKWCLERATELSGPWEWRGVSWEAVMRVPRILACVASIKYYWSCQCCLWRTCWVGAKRCLLLHCFVSNVMVYTRWTSYRQLVSSPASKILMAKGLKSSCIAAAVQLNEVWVGY